MDLIKEDSGDDHVWQKVVYRKRYQKQETAGFSGMFVPNESLTNGSSNNVFGALMVAPPDVSLSKAAAKIDPSHLAAFLAEYKDMELDLWRFYFYLEDAFSQVSLRRLKMFKGSPLSKLINVPLCHIPKSVYETSAVWIKHLPTDTHQNFVISSLDKILTDWASQKGNAQRSSSKSQVATVVELAMVLRSNTDALTPVLPMLRHRLRYQGQDKLLVIVWMLAQASQSDLSFGLYSWAHVLLPLVNDYKCYSRQSMNLILQFVEIILSNPEARTILVNRAVREGERLIPPSSFEILLRLTFPDSSARVEATERFEAVYPLLKEVALAPENATDGNAVEKIFTFSFKLAGEGNPGLAKEAAAIAIWSVTENVDCFQEWDMLYEEHLEASVALLRKLVDEWKDHSPKLSSSLGTVYRTMNSFRLKNEKAITEGGANCSLYKEAAKSCKLILRRLSRGSGSSGSKYKHITTVVLATLLCFFFLILNLHIFKHLVCRIKLRLTLVL